MAAAAPPPTSPTVPTAAAPSAPARPVAPPAPLRVGRTRDEGTVRRDSVDLEEWTARGTVKVIRDVNVGTARLDGSASIGGKLTAGAFGCRGALEVEGPVDVTGSFSSLGELRASSTFHAGEADLRGEVRLSGAVSVDRLLNVRGTLLAPSLRVDALLLEGEAHVPGEIVGRSVTARFTRNSTLGTVRAGSVVLRGRTPNLFEKVLGREFAVTLRRVEAEMVDLEGVDVKFVHAPSITLGRDAHITEYEGTIVRRHPTSRVGFESRSPRPYGLSR